MEITLINYTKDGLKIIADAVRITGPFFGDMSDEKIVRYMVKHDYSSTLEHIYFTFGLKDISVALSRELLEHRVASHTAKSTRYISQAKEMPVYLPPDIKGDLLKEVKEHIERTHELYKKIEENVSRESARYILPLGLECSYVWTVNCRSLLNFLRLRLCKNAAPEINLMANKIKGIVLKIYPEIFEGVECRGSQWGICPEPRKRSCGKYPTKRD
jgi:thymidylate synthase (FAD)